ncbi:MAG: hypothetical protein K5882_05115 [Bacteroidales bacterium]|nr:hypothetical protein [Bacteroidales bacterium]
MARLGRILAVYVEPYSYPWYKFKGRDGDETLCLTYKNAKGKTKKVRFGLLRNDDQQECVIERIKELCVDSDNSKQNAGL